jgi:serine/threonine protein kinase
VSRRERERESECGAQPGFVSVQGANGGDGGVTHPLCALSLPRSLSPLSLSLSHTHNAWQELSHLVMGLLAKDPRQRLQWDQLLAHPFWREPWPEDMLPPGGGPGGMLQVRFRRLPVPPYRFNTRF